MQNKQKTHKVIFPKDTQVTYEAFHCLSNVWDWGYLDDTIKTEDPLRYRCCKKIYKAKKSVTLTHDEWLCVRIWVDDAVDIMSDNIIDDGEDYEWTTERQKQLEQFYKKYFS